MRRRDVPDNYTSKQMADACEILIAAELTLRGIPALKVPDLWPEYDVIAQPADREPQRVSVKPCAFKAGSANHIANLLKFSQRTI
jgi:hypothetical protein